MTLQLATAQFAVVADKLPADYGKAAPVGLFVLLALAVVVFFGARSMIKHVRKVPATFSSAAKPPAPEEGSPALDKVESHAKLDNDSDPKPGQSAL